MEHDDKHVQFHDFIFKKIEQLDWRIREMEDVFGKKMQLLEWQMHDETRAQDRKMEDLELLIYAKTAACCGGCSQPEPAAASLSPRPHPTGLPSSS